MDYYHNNSYNGAHSDNASVTKNAKKKKATKGAAAPVKLSTDPQSVAARERRHRISEKFKTLQSLVPGGAKMDTVSMLDEAIHYVKFLKTQIWLHETLISGDQCSSEYHQSFKSVIPADAYSQSSFQPQQQQELQCCSESCFEWSQCCDLSSVDAAASGGGGGSQSSWVFDMPEVQFASEMTLF
ncbi:unnamed protein product [Rhodiola kirilowii]